MQCRTQASPRYSPTRRAAEQFTTCESTSRRSRTNHAARDSCKKRISCLRTPANTSTKLPAPLKKQSAECPCPGFLQHLLFVANVQAGDAIATSLNPRRAHMPSRALIVRGFTLAMLSMLVPNAAHSQGMLRGVARLGAEFGGEEVIEFRYSAGTTPDVTAGSGLLLTGGGQVSIL